jgi:hypothetical protein
MGNQRKTAHRISTVVEVNKQSFGKDIVANCGAACQGKSSATQKGLTGWPLRVRLAVVNRWAVDDPIPCEADHDATERESALAIVTRLRRGGP